LNHGWDKKRKDELLDPCVPNAKRPGSRTVRDLVGSFLTSMRQLISTGEPAGRSFDDYHCTPERPAKTFGQGRAVKELESADFDRLRASFARKW
jgi:hypothetical protein